MFFQSVVCLCSLFAGGNRAKAFNFGEVNLALFPFFKKHFKGFIYCIFFLSEVCDMQDLSSLTRDQTCAPLHWEC